MSRATRALPGRAILAAAGMAALVAAAAGPGPLLAQRGGVSPQGVLLREAVSHEARGDLDQAEAVLHSLLRSHPGSTGGLLALERVLREDGRVREVLPWADRQIDAEPDASGAWRLKLRLLAEVDSLGALQETARAWARAEPRSVEPYREGGRVLEAALGPGPSLTFLREGSERLDEPGDLLVEIGGLLVRTGDPEGAARAWSVAVGADGERSAAVADRVRELDEGREAVVAPLVEALDADPTTLDRRRAAVRIALGAGMPGSVLDVAQRVLDAGSSDVDRGFLTDLAARAEEAGEPAVALWAYRRLVDRAADPVEVTALERRVARAALASGDTVAAIEAQVHLAERLDRGSAARRVSVAELIRLQAALSASPTPELVRRVEGYRVEFPDAPDLDALVAEVAAALHARGASADANRVLEGIAGPRTSLERAYLLLEDGDIEGGRAAVLSSLAGLPPERATEAIQLAALLDRLTAPGADLVARGAVLVHRSRGADAFRLLEAGVDSVTADDRPALLAHAARVAQAARLPDEAARVRTRLLEGYPDAPETAEATLELARWHALRPGGAAEAATLLEDLIVARPNNPVVPEARRELARIRGAAREPDVDGQRLHGQDR